MDKCIEGMIRNKPYLKEAILIFGEAGPEFTNREFMQKHPEFNERYRPDRNPHTDRTTAEKNLYCS